jgi:hypothetical protein
MPTDVNFPITKPPKILSPQGAGGNSNTTPLIGVVKDNIDPTRSGRIRVALQRGKGAQDPNSSEGWVTVQKLSNFFGSVGGDAGTDVEDHGTYKTNPSSYGMWHAPPDIGTQVVCIFINGDPNYGFYIGCIPEPEKLQMVPAIGAVDNVTLNESEANSYGGATRLPTTNMNVNNKSKSDSAQFLETARPVHSYTASIMMQQGILRDAVRGPISSSASRETASRVGFGVSTPGRPIYTGGFDDTNLPKNLETSNNEKLQVVARRGGHSIVMDDGDVIGRDQLIRIRTSLGHQIMMSDDGQTLMILHSNGQSYVELGKEGTVDIYSTNSFNVRTQGDINFHADQDINIHAMENLNIQAKNIHCNSEEMTKFRAGKDFNVNALSNFTAKSGSAAAISAGGEASLVGGGATFVNGAKVNINSGAPGLNPPEVPIITLNAQPDTLFDEEKGWAAAPGKLLTVTSRAPAHAPWASAGQGISIKTSASASDSLPPTPSNAVQQANQAGQNANSTPPSTATVASVPQTKPVSPSVDTGTTGSTLAAVGKAAANGATAPAVQKGAAIISSGQNPAEGGSTATVAAGAFGQTAKQLADSGVIKPGADKLINGLASVAQTAGKVIGVTKILSNTLFTGQQGAETIGKFATNVEAQAKSVINTLQKGQTLLTQAGVISGKETPTQTAGLVVAAATTGANNTINAVKESANKLAAIGNEVTDFGDAVGNTITKVGGSIGGEVGATLNKVSDTINQFSSKAASVTNALGKASSALNAIGSGSSAAGQAASLGGLAGIANAVGALTGGSGPSLSSLINSVNGIAAGAYDAIKNGFPKLKANVPQKLSAIAKEAAAKSAATAQTTTNAAKSGGLSSLAGGVGKVLSGATSVVNTITEGTKTIENTIGGVSGAINNATATSGNNNNAISGVTGAIETGLNKLTTGAQQVSGVLSDAGNVATSLSNITSGGTGSNSVGGTLSNLAGAASDVTGFINKATGALGDVTGGVNKAINTVNGLAGAGAALKGGLSDLANAAKNVQAGGNAAKAVLQAAGINNLPGGLNAIASVADKKNAPVHIPGAKELTNLANTVGSGLNAAKDALGKVGDIAGKASGVLNQVSGVASDVSGAVGTVSGVAGQIGGAVGAAQGALGNATGDIGNLANKVTSVADKLGGVASALGDAGKKLNGITSSITGALNSGEASSLLSSLSALGAGGPSPIKLPEVGFNTFNRDGITSQVNSLLGDPGIPKPNLVGEVSDDTVNSLNQKVETSREAIKKANDELNQAIADTQMAKQMAIKAIDQSASPESDPNVQNLKKAWQEKVKIMKEKADKLAALESAAA